MVRSKSKNLLKLKNLTIMQIEFEEHWTRAHFMEHITFWKKHMEKVNPSTEQ